jgi:predicted amidohydrolase YtcJ
MSIVLLQRLAHPLLGLLAATAVPAAIPQGPAPIADTVYVGGPILTMNDAAPRAEAIAVKDGRIVAVGSRSEVAKQQTTATKVVDLGGKALLPGFIDGHGHVFTSGIQAASANLLPAPDGEGNSIAKLQELLRAYASTPTAKKFA